MKKPIFTKGDYIRLKSKVKINRVIKEQFDAINSLQDDPVLFYREYLAPRNLDVVEED